MSQNLPENVPEVASHDLLSFEDRCRAWLEKQPSWEAKVELGKLLMIPLMELSSAQLARLEELREVLEDHPRSAALVGCIASSNLPTT